MTHESPAPARSHKSEIMHMPLIHPRTLAEGKSLHSPPRAFALREEAYLDHRRSVRVENPVRPRFGGDGRKKKETRVPAAIRAVGHGGERSLDVSGEKEKAAAKTITATKNKNLAATSTTLSARLQKGDLEKLSVGRKLSDENGGRIVRVAIFRGREWGVRYSLRSHSFSRARQSSGKKSARRVAT